MSGEMDEITKKMREILAAAPKCKVCGADLPRYSFYSELYEWRTCPDCKTTFKKRRVGVR